MAVAFRFAARSSKLDLDQLRSNGAIVIVLEQAAKNLAASAACALNEVSSFHYVVSYLPRINVGTLLAISR